MKLVSFLLGQFLRSCGVRSRRRNNSSRGSQSRCQMFPVSPLRPRNRGNLIIRHSKINATRINATRTSSIRINVVVTAGTLSTNNGVRISRLRSAMSKIS